MARRKNPGKARHLHIDPYVWVKEDDALKTYADDARVDRALAWYECQPAGQRTRLCWDLIVAAVNGELGVAAPVALDGGEDEAAKAALQDLLSNMVLDEEE